MLRLFVPSALFLGLIQLLAACTLSSDPFEPEHLVGRLNDADAGDVPSRPILSPPPMTGAEPTAASPDCVGSSELTGCVLGLGPPGGGCASDLDCESLVCSSGECSPATCSDERKNGSETDIDCGASCEARCATGTACAGNSDCASRSCASGRCQEPSCDDGIRNPGEADVDCGGACDDGCASGLACEQTSDCGAGLFCPTQTRVCTSVSCQDAVLNGDETNADCGGGECPGCATGSTCEENVDCESLVCGAGQRCAAPSCDDDVRNQDETAADCGGGCAANCATGQACEGAGDCVSRVCSGAGCGANLELCCQAPSCTDGILNGNEPVVDCGNAACGLCPLNRACTANAQCGSGFCQAGVCRVDPCDDDVQNGTESDTDCGGNDARCSRCGLGDSCAVNADCGAGTCVSGVCAACADGQANGSETDVDCGGVCGDCAPGLLCDGDADCQSGVCEDGRCCGGREVDCTRCARRLVVGLSCNSTTDATAASNCERFLDCLAANPEECPVRHAEFCSADPVGVCNHNAFGGNGGGGLLLADNILGTASCFF